MQLPTSLTVRPATMADADAVFELASAASMADAGERVLDRDDIVTDWTAPGFVLATQTVMVFAADADGPVAFAQIAGERADVDVHPDWRRRGIGEWLVRWTEERALELSPERDVVRIGQTVLDGVDGVDELFESHAYEPLWDSWILRLPPEREVADPPPVTGLTIRSATTADERRAYEIIERAFGVWDHREARSFEEWQSSVSSREIFDPELLLIAELDGVAVGSAVGLQFDEEGWIDQLAVDSDARGRGIGRALLAALFEKFRSRGDTKIGLNTDSRTGALGLYLDVGMEVEHTYRRWSKVLHRS